MCDRAPAESDAGELLTGDHAVLALGERCDQGVEWMRATLSMHFMLKCIRVSHGPDGGGESVSADPMIATKLRKEQR